MTAQSIIKRYPGYREVELEEVLRCFLRAEANRSKFACKKEELLKWCELSKAELRQKVREWAHGRDDKNPLLVWTVGISEDKHYEKIDQWGLAQVPLMEIFSSGINEAMKDDLDAVKGNVLDFVEKFAGKYAEFNNQLAAENDLGPLAVIAHEKVDRRGKLELIDGVHRAVAMIRGGKEWTSCYVGILTIK